MSDAPFIPPGVANRDRFLDAIRRMDDANARDPRSIDTPEGARPFELAYARRLTEWVRRLAPEASEALALAARGQHIGRWEIPRGAHPEGLKGYLQWREALKALHAEKVAGILRACGYDDAAVGQVVALVTKANFPDDPESQVIEDALCLVFLETQLAEFAATKPRDKAVDILRKTWGKMSPRAKEIAAGLPLPPAAKELVMEAVGA